MLKRCLSTALYTLFYCYVFASIFAGYLVLKIVFAPDDPEAIARESFSRINTSERYEAARRYHGVLVTEFRHDIREWGFYRDGKWCPLYRSIPKSYWDRIERKKSAEKKGDE